MKLIYICFASLLWVASSFAQNVPRVAETVSINGIDMYYEVYGEGEPLLLLHYWTGSTQMWEPFIEDFSENHRLIVYDQRGHGRSGFISNTQNMFHQSALDGFALMDCLEIDRFKAIGLSVGAQLLIHMATLEPERVESMILVGGGHYFPTENRAALQSMTYAEQSEEQKERLRERHVGGGMSK